jgi:PAS domain S-box-containing protein
MTQQDKVNILLVDDQPGKLLTYEAILSELDENLLRAGSGREALEHLLKNDVAVILVDVCMPDLDGFQLAAMIREHPRFRKTAMIFISAIHLSDMDRLRGYEMGAVDYVPVPVVPEVLRAKVRVFCELYRKTRDLEVLNRDLEKRVRERTAELENTARQLAQSERRRSLALAAGNMGSWQWNRQTDEYQWDEGQYRIFGIEPGSLQLTSDSIRARIKPEDWTGLQISLERLIAHGESNNIEFRVVRPNGEVRWCLGAAVLGGDGERDIVSGVTIDITDRKDAEDRQVLLAREVDHRAKNALALVQSIIRLTKAGDQKSYIAAVEGRIRALSRAHNVLAQSRWQGASISGLVDEELAPYRTSDPARIVTGGPEILLQPAAAQTLAMALHELATNAAKYGSLSEIGGRLVLKWHAEDARILLHWQEECGPPVSEPKTHGFGSRVIRASIEKQLEGRVTFDWRPEGLVCVIEIPATGKAGYASPIEPQARGHELASAEPSFALAGNRIMVAEDEAVVSLALCEVLTELGFEVVGPFGSTVDALQATHTANFDAAILDVNLNGDLIYPVAQILMERGLPFIFVTGYGPESIDRRFRDVVALHKPVDAAMLAQLFGSNAARRTGTGTRAVAG